MNTLSKIQNQILVAEIKTEIDVEESGRAAALASLGKPLADDLLVAATAAVAGVAVDVGGVDEIDVGVKDGRCAVVLRLPVAEFDEAHGGYCSRHVKVAV